MRSIFYSLATLLLLTAFFSLSALLSNHDRLLSEQESTLVRLERIDFLFENVGQDLTNVLGYECGVGQDTVNISIIITGNSTPPSQTRVINYETFVENNFPGAQLDLTGLLNDLGTGNKYTIIIDGRQVQINYNVPKISFDLVDGTNLTLDFPGYTDHVDWQPLHTGTIPFCIMTSNSTNCQLIGGASNADIYVNDTSHQPAGRIQVQIAGNLGVKIFTNLVDYNLIPELNLTLGFNRTGNPLYLNGAYLTYTLQDVNRTDGIRICE